MITTANNEFDVDLEQEGQGMLLITDAQLLIRPAIPGQYPASVKHDSARVNWLLDLGDTGNYGEQPWHIVTGLSAADSHKLLDRVFYSYVDYFCMAKIWVDAGVFYIGANGEVLRTEEYGFTDGEYALSFYVYCNDFLPDSSDWSALIGRLDDIPSVAIPADQLEDYLMTRGAEGNDEPMVILRPADVSDNPDGFTARGFMVDVG